MGSGVHGHRKNMTRGEAKEGRMFLTYPLVISIPGKIAFRAVVVSNLLVAPPWKMKTDEGGVKQDSHRPAC